MGRKRVDLSSGTKKCPACKETKPVDQFHKSNHTKHGLSVYCKVCQFLRHDKWRLGNKPVAAALAKKWRENNPERSRDHDLKRTYGLPLGSYAAMLAEQNGKCAICGSSDPGGKGRFHVDHCHSEKHVRGLLCHNCNVGIGNLRHSEVILRSAIDYLNRTTS